MTVSISNRVCVEQFEPHGIHFFRIIQLKSQLNVKFLRSLFQYDLYKKSGAL